METVAKLLKMVAKVRDNETIEMRDSLGRSLERMGFRFNDDNFRRGIAAGEFQISEHAANIRWPGLEKWRTPDYQAARQTFEETGAKEPQSLAKAAALTPAEEFAQRQEELVRRDIEERQGVVREDKTISGDEYRFRQEETQRERDEIEAPRRAMEASINSATTKEIAAIKREGGAEGLSKDEIRAMARERVVRRRIAAEEDAWLKANEAKDRALEEADRAKADAEELAARAAAEAPKPPTPAQVKRAATRADKLKARAAAQRAKQEEERWLKRNEKKDLEGQAPRDEGMARTAGVLSLGRAINRLNQLSKKKALKAAERDEFNRLTKQIASARKDQFPLELIDGAGGVEAFRNAGDALAPMLEDDTRPWSVSDIMQTMLEHVNPDSDYHEVARQTMETIRDLGLKTKVEWGNVEDFDSPNHVAATRINNDGSYTILLNRDFLNYERMAGREPSTVLGHAMLHESVHAATLGALKRNRTLYEAMDGLRQQAIKAGLDHYGLKNVEEFVAEAFSNPEFQDALSNVKFEREPVSLGEKLWSFVRRLVGLKGTVSDDVLSAVTRRSEHLFTGENAAPNRANERYFLSLKDRIRAPLVDAIDRLRQTQIGEQFLHPGAEKDFRQMVRDKGLRAALSAASLEYIEKFNRASFDRADGPNFLSRYYDEFMARGATVSKFMSDASGVDRKWLALHEQDAKEALALSRLATDATVHGIHPDEKLNSEANAHLTNPAQARHHARLAAEFGRLKPETQALYTEIRKYYSDAYQTETKNLMRTVLHAFLTGGTKFLDGTKVFTHDEFDARYTPEYIEKKELMTREGLDREFGKKLDEDALKLISKIGSFSKVEGPYFPLKREGKWVVYAEKPVATKNFATRRAALNHAADLQAENPMLEVNVEPSKQGGFDAVSVEKDYRMTDMYSQAQKHREDMIAKYGPDAKVTDVQLRRDLYTLPETVIGSNKELAQVLGKLKDSPNAQMAVKDYYLNSLAQNSFRKRMINRENRAGVDYDRQFDNFRQYVRSAAYYNAQLVHGWKMSHALSEMEAFSERVAGGDEKGNASATDLQTVIRELNLRDQGTRSPDNPNNFIRSMVGAANLWFLASPSYWLVNSSQPWMVSLPYLRARHGLSASVAAMMRAQKLVASPLVREAVSSMGGLKALVDRVATEQAFSVVDQLKGHIEKNAGARAGQYLDMLNTLKKYNVLDFTMQSEHRALAKTAAGDIAQRVFDASRIMNHLTEVNNRVMTAIAAYELMRGRWDSNATMTEEQKHEIAVRHAQEVTSLTHFNYSPGNKGRIFGPNGLLRGYSPAAFQFLQYPLSMYSLFIHSVKSGLKGATPAEKAEGWKTVRGLLLSHAIAGGLVGATLQPVKWALGLMLYNMEDDGVHTGKDIWSGAVFDDQMRQAAHDIFGEDLGKIVSTGIASAAGLDISKRMSFASLYNLDFNTSSSDAFFGSLLSNFGGAALGQVMNFYKGAGLMADGKYERAIEAVAPKSIRDVARFTRFASEGVKTNDGTTLLHPEDMTPWELFATMMGFNPQQATDVSHREHMVRSQQVNLNNERRDIIRQYQAAETPEDKMAIREKAVAWSQQHRQHDVQPITVADLMRQQATAREKQREVEMYGTTTRKPTDLSKQVSETFPTRHTPAVYENSRTATPMEWPTTPRRAIPATVGDEGTKTFPELLAENEEKYDIPSGLLTRMVSRESKFNPNAVSPKGAVGYGQFMPEAHPGVDPRDPNQVAPEMGRSMRDYFNRFGSWDKALAAYNWGEGNLSKAISRWGDHWFEHAPRETRDYVRSLGG